MRHRSRKLLALLLLGGGAVFAGPCGITTLQLQDFLRSSVIRTAVTTFAAVLEAATVDAAANDRNNP